MDPRISAGFNILGNALMPDPRDLAQAQVLRSQMLQNEASTGKLTAETDALKRAAEQLALLQDILSNPRSSAQDIISRGAGAGLTNDPSQLPGFALGTVALQEPNFNIDDPASFSRALQATGQTATYAGTPSGFAADQARQEREAVAKDLTTQRGQNTVYDASIYDTDVDAKTSIETQRMEDLRQIAINTADNDLLRAVEAAKNATQIRNDTLASRDRNAQIGADENYRQRQLALDASIARNKDAADLEKTRLEGGFAGERNDATNTSAYQRAIDVAEIQARSAADVQKLKDAAAGTAGPKFSYADTKNFQTSVRNRMALSVDPDVDVTDKDARNKLIKGINIDDWDKVVQLAMTLHPDNPIAQVELGVELFKYNPTTKTWRFRRKAYNNYLNGWQGPGDTDDDAPGDTEEPNPPVAEATPVLADGIPDTSVPAEYKDTEGKEIWPLNGKWVRADGTPAKE